MSTSATSTSNFLIRNLLLSSRNQPSVAQSQACCHWLLTEYLNGLTSYSSSNSQDRQQTRRDAGSKHQQCPPASANVGTPTKHRQSNIDSSTTATAPISTAGPNGWTASEPLVVHQRTEEARRRRRQQQQRFVNVRGSYEQPASNLAGEPSSAVIEHWPEVIDLSLTGRTRGDQLSCEITGEIPTAAAARIPDASQQRLGEQISSPSLHNQQLHHSRTLTATKTTPNTTSKGQRSCLKHELVLNQLVGAKNPSHKKPARTSKNDRERDKTTARLRRTRTMFSEWQLGELEWRFSRNKYLITSDRHRIAKLLDLDQLQVKTWFQNRRMKWKKQILASGIGVKSPTKPKGRPKRDSIPPIDDDE